MRNHSHERQQTNAYPHPPSLLSSLRRLLLPHCPDYTHVIALGPNDITNVVRAAERYGLGGAGYVDPVPFEDVFTVNETTGSVDVTFEPVITVSFVTTAVSMWHVLEKNIG